MTIFDEFPIASLSSLSPEITDEAAKILRDKIDDEMARLLVRALDSKPIDIGPGKIHYYHPDATIEELK